MEPRNKLTRSTFSTSAGSDFPCSQKESRERALKKIRSLKLVNKFKKQHPLSARWTQALVRLRLRLKRMALIQAALKRDKKNEEAEDVKEKSENNNKVNKQEELHHHPYSPSITQPIPTASLNRSHKSHQGRILNNK